MKKRALAVALTGIMVANQLIVPVSAKENELVDMSVKVCVEFTKEDADAYKESISEALNSSVEDLENEILLSENENKVALLETYKNEIENYDVSGLFEENQDGTYTMEIPYVNMDVNVNGAETSTDEQGNVALPRREARSNDIDVEIKNFNDELELEVVKDQNDVNCKINMTFEQFADGVQSMSDNMQDAEAQKVTQVFYGKRAVGKSFGYGAGKSYIYFDTNIVGCNKCDESESKQLTTKQFALENSDCSKSVKLGVVALGGGLALATYYRYSIFCVQEGMTSIISTDNANNAYCDHSKKSKGHVNCSWFNGIGHSESFHTHKY